MSNFRLSFSKCPAVLCKLLVNILQAKFIRNFPRKYPSPKFTIVKGYYSSKELFIETFRLAVYPGNFSKIFPQTGKTRGLIGKKFPIPGA
jgi:hypothetical protein